MTYIQTQTDTRRRRHMSSSAGPPCNFDSRDLPKLDLDKLPVLDAISQSLELEYGHIIFLEVGCPVSIEQPTVDILLIPIVNHLLDYIIAIANVAIARELWRIRRPGLQTGNRIIQRAIEVAWYDGSQHRPHEFLFIRLCFDGPRRI